MTKYVALIRGINIGPNKRIKMDELRATFESLGFQNVKTILATGNVLFETPQTDSDTLKDTIQETLVKTFIHNVPVILRTSQQIEDLANSNPFKDIIVTKDTRLYVTFLPEKPVSTLQIPYQSPELDFEILQVTHGNVCSVLTLTPKSRTVDSMKILEKEFGKNITTRNWNTVNKVLIAFNS